MKDNEIMTYVKGYNNKNLKVKITTKCNQNEKPNQKWKNKKTQEQKLN